MVDWYLGLSLGQKIVVGVAVSALVLVGSYLASLLILSVAAETSFSAGTFSQKFIRDEERNVEDHIDPGSDYWAVCWAQFSGGAATGNEAPVEGVPPG